MAPLVGDMAERLWAELALYERVVRNWPAFGPYVEAAMCKVCQTCLHSGHP